MDAYLTKPLKPLELYQAIESVLLNSRPDGAPESALSPDTDLFSSARKKGGVEWARWRGADLARDVSRPPERADARPRSRSWSPQTHAPHHHDEDPHSHS
jgi:DNA-binding response OmpR family regulator